MLDGLQRIGMLHERFSSAVTDKLTSSREWEKTAFKTRGKHYVTT